MLKKVKRYLAVLILSGICLLISFSKSIDLFILKFQQIEIQNEMEQMIKNNSSSEKIQTLVFRSENFSQLKWLKKNKEFVYHENRYDVVKIVHSEKFVIIKCYADDREDRLFAEFEKLSKEKSNSESENKNSPEDFSENILSAIITKNNSFDFSNSKELSFAKLHSYYIHSIENESPPPKV